MITLDYSLQWRQNIIYGAGDHKNKGSDARQVMMSGKLLWVTTHPLPVTDFKRRM
jgi:hypothetical protein